MSNTPNLNIPLVETNQSQKEVTMNTAIWAFERALTESTEIECDDGTTAVTDEEAREAVHLRLTEVSGLSAPFTVELPAIKRLLIVTNSTGQDATIVCEAAESGSAEAELGDGETSVIYCDATQVFAASVGGGSGQQALLINNQSGTSYTLDLSDAGALVTLDNASPIALTVPDNDDVAFPIGTSILLAQIGAGQVTVVEDNTSVTVITPETLKLRKQGAQAALVKIATDTWLLDGNLEAA